MVRGAIFAAAILAGAMGPAGAQGFSGSGAAGVAQLRGATASPGLQPFYGSGEPSPDARPAPVRRGRPIEVDDAAPADRPDAVGFLPWR